MDNTSLSFKRRFKLSRFFKGEAPAGGPLELTQRRVFILPTQRGMGMVGTTVLLLLIAFIYNNNLVYLLSFLLASIFFVTILHTFKALAGLVVRAGPVQPVFAGEAAGFTVTVSNPGKHQRPALSANLENEQSFSLDADESKTLTLYVATRKRGWLLMDTVTLASTYPLGAFRAWSPLRFNSKVLVYPKPGAAAIPFPEGGGTGEKGAYTASRAGQDEFNGVRGYQAGDPLRQIHWKAYAKGQGLYSKQYAGDEEVGELWLDYSKAPGGHFEERISQLCRWVLDAEQAGLKYGLLLPGRKLEPGCGKKHYSSCLEALALV